MPYTKIFTIKDNIKRSVDYITQELKTNHKLITFSNCSLDNTYFDFESINKKFNSKVKIKARHIVQSYSVDDKIDSEKALSIARDFAEKHLLNHQYIIAIHTDQKHIHAHIIFNTVNMKTGKAYRSNKSTFNNILIKDFNEVLEKNNINKVIVKNKEKFHKFKIKTNLRERLIIDIDRNIKISNSYNDFIKNMSRNYEIKDNKYLSMKNKLFGKSFIRCSKKLGIEYTKEEIIFRINNKNIQNNLGFIVDTKENYKARTKIGYRNWAKKNNINTINKIYLLLKNKYNIEYNYFDNIDKLIKKNNSIILNNLEDNTVAKLQNYELKKIKEIIEKYNEKENISSLEK